MDPLSFVKMHGLGNDFIILDGIAHPLDLNTLPQLAKQLCDRHVGIGADGILYISIPASSPADVSLRIFNPDGSEPEMCGNGIRCVARYLFDYHEKKTTLAITTKAGVMRPEIIPSGANCLIRVDMGPPALLERETQLPLPGGASYPFTSISMGNPHCIIFVDDVSVIPLETMGPRIEHHPHFPNRTNVEFVEIVDKKQAKVRVWERGAGETLACGTGACASWVAAHIIRNTERTGRVHLPGGTLEIAWERESNHVFMTGPADYVYQGVLKAS